MKSKLKELEEIIDRLTFATLGVDPDEIELFCKKLIKENKKLKKKLKEE